MTEDSQGGRAGGELGERELSGLWSELADAVVIADPAGTIVFWNVAAERIFGWPAAEARGQTLDLIIPERLRARHWAGYERVMATGHTSYGDRLLEVPAMHRDGQTLSVAFTVTLTTDPDGRVSHIVAVLRDETERWNERRDLLARLRALDSSEG
ncbi:PAS domain S-box protein [Aquihabitans daechungensis]|uniref:PAS domain S-box protein n=1 Tax=Aquihabitans daechungensis TaxID=1052257 RepID=UPI003BA14A47